MAADLATSVDVVAAPMLAGVPVAFVLFGLTLAGVALFHHHTLRVALTGLAVITAYKLAFSSFEGVTGLAGLAMHLGHEWVVLANLLGLLVGFGLLADHFEKSHVPGLLPAMLPDDWRGGVMLLALVFVLSTFLDNIAAAMIGGTVAASVYRGRVHVAYLVAIVAASNAGGAGSVMGDTTTTMMWIEGISPFEVLRAFLPAVVALAVFAWPASRLQQQLSPIVRDPAPGLRLNVARIVIVCIVLGAVITTNVVVNTRFTHAADQFPFLGLAVWIALLATAPWHAPDWRRVPGSVLSSLFLLSLVLCASMMPVERLPDPSWHSTIGLGFLSAVFDNIPLTKLALEQGGYDWAALAFAVGFGGSMVWFGSSAGVALCSQYPQAKSVVAWVRHGWIVAVGYAAGMAVYFLLLGWRPL